MRTQLTSRRAWKWNVTRTSAVDGNVNPVRIEMSLSGLMGDLLKRGDTRWCTGLQHSRRICP